MPKLSLLMIIIFLTACQPEEPPPVQADDDPTITSTVFVDFTLTPSPSDTPTASSTMTSTATLTASPSPTLDQPIVQTTALMVAQLSDRREEIIYPTTPPLGEVVPNATAQPAPHLGWQTFESDHPAFSYDGEWQAILSDRASRHQYHFTTAVADRLSFSFTGQAIAIQYVTFHNGGRWQLSIDDQAIDTVENYSPSAQFMRTDVINLDAGVHTLKITVLDDKHPDSSDHMVAIDAIHVYQAQPMPQPTRQPSSTPYSVQSVELLQGAPTIQPTATDSPPQVVGVSVVIAYDENANRSIDPAEGVADIPLRLVEVGTNRILTDGFTDIAGFATLSTVTNNEVRLVVPYFGAYWDVSTRQAEQTFSLLIPAGNQPGLIP